MGAQEHRRAAQCHRHRNGGLWKVHGPFGQVRHAAIKAYNGVAAGPRRVLRTRGQPLPEGFTIFKVRAVRANVANSLMVVRELVRAVRVGVANSLMAATTHLGDCISHAHLP